MSASCCESHVAPQTIISPRFRKVLWVALFINAAMFFVEVAGGLSVGSVSLLADALDFAGDAANYGITLAVLHMGLTWRARAALVKGYSMILFGVFVAGKTAWAAFQGVPPEPVTMGVIAILALLSNGFVAFLLYAFRDGDANMRSVWLCSRNDAIGNVAVLLAAVGVFAAGSHWPDLIVATVMAVLALSSGIEVVRLAKKELSTPGELGATAPESTHKGHHHP